MDGSIRRMQEEEAREASRAQAAAGEILDELTAAEKAAVPDRVRTRFAAIERGEYTDYAGRAGLAQLAAAVSRQKSLGR